MVTETPLGLRYWNKKVSMNLTGFSFLVSLDVFEKAILYAK